MHPVVKPRKSTTAETPEEKANRETAKKAFREAAAMLGAVSKPTAEGQRLKDAARRIDRANAIRDGLIAPPWRAKPEPEPSTSPSFTTPPVMERQPRSTRSKSMGAPRDYDHDGIIAVARELIALGVDDMLTMFRDRVMDALPHQRPPIKPPSRSHLLRLVRPIYNAAKFGRILRALIWRVNSRRS
jgi:hypothetical protein